MELSVFGGVALLLVSALLAVAALKILRFPTIPAYFIAGMFAGPQGLGVLQSSEASYFAAELGIILLLFTIGLKFSINALKSIRHTVFVLGGLQTGLTLVVFAVPAYLFFQDTLLAVLIGAIAAMSSTAIVSRILIEENALTSPVGRRSLGILLFQDLAVIPLIIIYSEGNTDASLWTVIPLLALKIVLVLAFSLSLGPRLMNWWLNWISRYGDKELFILNIISVIVVSALLTGLLGLSYVLGAFMAGILIAETFHRHRVEQVTEPFRQLFLGFFFMSLGTLIDPYALRDNVGIIALMAVVLLFVKIPIVYGCVRAVRTHQLTALQTALLLGGVGEFGFVLLTVAHNSGIIKDELFQLLVPANMIGLIVTPFIWSKNKAIAGRLLRDDWLTSANKIGENFSVAGAMKGHVIIGGFGRTGQAISGILRALSVDFIALETDHVILEAVGKTEKVIYGASDSTETLIAAGILRASTFVVSFDGVLATAVLSIQAARRLNPKIRIIAKANTVDDAGALSAAGADEVLVAAHEAGFSLAARGLTGHHTLSSQIIDEVFKRARSRENPLFQSQYTGLDDDDSEWRFVGFVVERLPGEELTLAAATAGASVVAWRREDKEMDIHRGEERLMVNDELILKGALDKLNEIRGELTGDSET